jgi:DNA-directed RNA polymerase subunit RPC12/RpoP
VRQKKNGKVKMDNEVKMVECADCGFEFDGNEYMDCPECGFDGMGCGLSGEERRMMEVWNKFEN